MRAAALKVLRHTYLVQQSGSQDVRVYAPPKDHLAWMYDEIVGSPEVVAPKLSAETEIFSVEEMRWMAGSLKIALKVCEDVKIKLADKSVDVKEAVKRWFVDEKSGDPELTDADREPVRRLQEDRGGLWRGDAGLHRLRRLARPA